MPASEKPVILVVSGSPIHKAKIIKKYVESIKGMLELDYLPPYSPKLNPDEQVWKLERIKSMPEIMIGFFNHPECSFVK